MSLANTAASRLFLVFDDVVCLGGEMVLVDLVFCRSCVKWPISVAVEFLMKRLTLLRVNTFHVLKCPLSIDLHHVVVFGLKQAPCVNLMHSSIGLYGRIK